MRKLLYLLTIITTVHTSSAIAQYVVILPSESAVGPVVSDTTACVAGDTIARKEKGEALDNDMCGHMLFYCGIATLQEYKETGYWHLDKKSSFIRYYDPQMPVF